MINVIPCEAAVKLLGTKIEGVVTGITIRRNNAISYEVSYWIDDRHYSEWFYDFEVGIMTDRIQVGFKND